MTEAHNQAVARYYRQTQWQYYGLWSGRSTLALHYGYWDEDVRSHRQALLRLNAVLADRAAVGAGDRVLDAGCGWGGSAIWLARERGARVEGITVEPAQVDVAESMARRRRVDARTGFALGDFTGTGFPDASFDVVWAVESVCHARDKTDFVREAYRVLKPGGRLVLSDFFRTRRPLADTEEALLSAWVRTWVVPDLETFGELRTKLRDAGFADVEVDDATDRIAPSARRLYVTGLVTAPLALLFRLVRIHNAEHHGNWLSSLRQYRALRAGAWRYGIVFASKR